MTRERTTLMIPESLNHNAHILLQSLTFSRRPPEHCLRNPSAHTPQTVAQQVFKVQFPGTRRAALHTVEKPSGWNGGGELREGGSERVLSAWVCIRPPFTSVLPP